MASGNLILGTARRKLGDVVMYRRNGEQQARVRVRKISNPKSEGQALQRNYMAPVSKFYAPLAGILERSWEGLDTSRSANAFMKANIDLARANGWYVQKGEGFTPLPYKVSKGIMQQCWYDFDSANSCIKWSIPGLTAQSGNITIAQLSAALVNIGFHYGDQITIIVMLGSGGYADYYPAWCRFLLSESETTTVKSLLPFVVDETTEANLVKFSGDVDEPLVGAAIIASRWDGKKWLRSTQFVVVDADYLSTYTGADARAAAIASYRGGDSVVQSDVYLNGGTGSSESSSEQGPTVEFNFIDPHQPVGLVTLTGVQKVSGGLTIVKGVRASNGAAVEMNLQDYRTGDSQYKFLDSSNEFTGTEATAPYALPYNSATDAIGVWLAKNGVTIA